LVSKFPLKCHLIGQIFLSVFGKYFEFYFEFEVKNKIIKISFATSFLSNQKEHEPQASGTGNSPCNFVHHHFVSLDSHGF
jgi:hypothetical protein